MIILVWLGFSVAYLVLNFRYINSETYAGNHQLNSLPDAVRLGQLQSSAGVFWVAVLGLIALLAQAVAFGAVSLRDKRHWRLDSRLFVLAFGLLSVSVILTFLLSAGRYNSIQLWQVYPSESILLGLMEVLATGALPDLWSVLRALAAAGFFAAASTALGMVVIRVLNGLFRSQLEVADTIILATAFLLGQGVLAIVFVLLSVFDVFSYFTLSALLLLSFALGLSPLIIVGRNALVEIKASLRQLSQETRLWKCIVALTMLLIGVTIFQAWARLSLDAASAYFVGAKLTVLTEQFAYTNRSYLAVSGSNAETTLAALILLFGDRSARLINWFHALAFALFCVAVAGLLGASRRGKIIVVAMVYTSTAILDLIGDGKTDLFGAATAMGALWWLLSSQRTNRRLALAICGLLSGLALLYRPTYAFPLPILITAAVVFHEAGSARPADITPRLRPILGSLFIVAIFASLPVISYLARNLALFGTPLVPALPGIAVETNPISSVADLSEWNVHWRTPVRLAFPVFATFVSTPYSLGVLTPLWLMFAPLVLVVLSAQRSAFFRQTSAAMRWLFPLVAALLISWLLLTPFVLEFRYVFMLWGLVFVFWAHGVERAIFVGNPLLDRIVAWLLIVLLIAMIVRSLYGVGVTTDQPREGGAPHCTSIGECRLLNSISQDADPGDRVLVVVPYSYYLRPDLLACSSTAGELGSLRSSLADGSESFWAAVYGLGFKYVAYAPRHATIFSPLGHEIDIDSLPNWLTLKPLYVGEHDRAFLIEADDSSLPLPAVGCQPAGNGRWTIQSIDN